MYTNPQIEGFFMTMTNSEARLIINNHIKAFTGISQDKIQWANQVDFVPPRDSNWCRVTVQYSDSFVSGLYNGQLERDFGIISIQNFTPKGHGDLSVISLADKWRNHWKGFKSSFFEVYQTHAPTDVTSEVSDAYAMSLVRIDFRVN